MNSMHIKMVKFIKQLRHTTQWRTTQHKQVNVFQYQVISHPKLHIHSFIHSYSFQLQ